MQEMRDFMDEKRVLVALSGGVDSSAAAVLLQKAGYCCDGATLVLCGEDQSAAAQTAAAQLGMNFFVFDEQARFCTEVQNPFIAAYCAGRTPNPCIYCNRALKFGAFLDRAIEMGYDYIATGHYARVDCLDGVYRLLRGADRRKDQSYFLYQLTQYQLKHLLLPVGGYDKPAIREIARGAGLQSADQSDSQDICFIPDGNYVAFLQQRGVKLVSGNFVDEDGKVLGRHRGLPCYTIGQGNGLGISLGRHVYVLKKNAADNTITLGDDASLYRSTLTADRVNWIMGVPGDSLRCRAKTRYSQTEADCTVTPLADDRIRVDFDVPQRAITAGQAVVLYDGDVVLGGGTIE